MKKLQLMSLVIYMVLFGGCRKTEAPCILDPIDPNYFSGTFRSTDLPAIAGTVSLGISGGF